MRSTLPLSSRKHAWRSGITVGVIGVGVVDVVVVLVCVCVVGDSAAAALGWHSAAGKSVGGQQAPHFPSGQRAAKRATSSVPRQRYRRLVFYLALLFERPFSLAVQTIL